MTEGVGQVQVCVLKDLETATAVTVRLTTQDKEALGEKGRRGGCVCVCVCVHMCVGLGWYGCQRVCGCILCVHVCVCVCVSMCVCEFECVCLCVYIYI